MSIHLYARRGRVCISISRKQNAHSVLCLVFEPRTLNWASHSKRPTQAPLGTRPTKRMSVQKDVSTQQDYLAVDHTHVGSSASEASAYYKNVLQDAGVITGSSAGNNDNCLAAVNECDCLEPNYNIASNSRGCLKCTTEDCSYYIQNIVETVLFDYNISVYPCSK